MQHLTVKVVILINISILIKDYIIYIEVTELKFNNVINEKIVCFDGAMGTLLIANGVPSNTNLSTLNMTDAKTILSIHDMYVNAGADIITTNTFTANSFKLQGLQFSTAEIVKRGVSLARLAAEEKLVALDIGPIGLIKRGNEILDFKYMYNIYKEQVEAGTEAGADMILIETMYDLREAIIAVLAAKENSDLSVACTLNFGKDYKMVNGTDPVTAVRILQGLGIDAVGVNCVEPKDAVIIAEDMVRYSKIPIIVQPNAGIPKYYQGNNYYDISKESFTEALVSLAEKGIRAVGGCCGTTPEYIRLLKKEIEDIPIVNTFPKIDMSICSSKHTITAGNTSKVIKCLTQNII